FVNKFGSTGTGNGEFNSVEGIDVDANYIYTTETGNNRVQIFHTVTYTFFYKFGKFGSEDGQFDSPQDISIDDNYIYVADSNNHRIQVFNKFTYTYHATCGEELFISVYGIDVDSDYIYAIDFDGQRYWIFSKGTHIAQINYPDFEYAPKSGYAPLTVAFTDLSPNSPISWYWEFGDGETSTLQNPTHIFNTAGMYIVRLTATWPNGSNFIEKFVFVFDESIILPPPLASFTVNVSLGLPPLTVNFTDTSQGHIISWYWDFGDGQNSALQNPSNIYAGVGIYVVTLTVTGDGGYISSATRPIIVTNDLDPEDNPPIADFTTNLVYGKAPLSVPFADISSGVVTSRLWEFGDGSTSTEVNPIHTYLNPGVYTVKLTVGNVYGQTSMTLQIIVLNIPFILKGYHGVYYVLDTGKHLIWMYQLDGTFIKNFGGYGTAIGKFRTPTGIAIIGGIEYLDRIIIEDLIGEG
ncbi:MAG: PKD domain-containing protein, partial [Candidatus Omnitrophota bacterium]